MIDVKIVSTGSHGNMNVIDDVIVIDCGVKRKLFESEAPLVEHVLISHCHSDHLSGPVMKWIAKTRPDIITHGVHLNTESWMKLEKIAPDVAKLFAPDLTPHSEMVIKTSRGDYHVETFPLVHDVENQGFILTSPSGETLVHATDTMTMRYCPDRLFDYLLVEGNWDEDVLVDNLTGDDDSVTRASRNLRHLSTQMCRSFMRSHSHPGSVMIQLHESEAFGMTLSL